MRVKLVFPPKWSYSQPYLSLPALTAYLRTNGIAVEQYDLNILALYFSLNKDRLHERVNLIIKNKLVEQLSADEQKKWADVLEFKEHTFASLDQALETLCSFQGLKDGRQKKYSQIILEKVMQIYSLPVAPEKNTLNKYTSIYNYYSSKEIIQAIQQPEKNIFYAFYQEIISELVTSTDFIGLSIIAIEQVIPGMVLAGMIKRQRPEIHLCIGGPIFTKWSRQTKIIQKFFQFIDSIILYEGELPLLKLINTLKSGQSLTTVPNLLYCVNNTIKQTATITPPNFDTLPTPDFQGLPLNKYLSPAISLPLLASRGCYWRQCSFCNHSDIYGNRYDLRHYDKLKNDFLTLHKKHQIKYINFSDESISPHLLRQISQILKELNLNIYWSCNMRFERSITAELVDSAYKAGLRIIFYGLESYNSRVRNLMQKGTDQATINRILRITHHRGIFNHLFFIMGFPTETRKELMETIDFLKKNQTYITAGGTSFTLVKNSPIHKDPDRYKITLKPDQTDLSLECKFVCSEGLSRQEVFDYVEKFNWQDILGSSRVEFNNTIHRDNWLIFTAHYPLEKIFSYMPITDTNFDVHRALQLALGVWYKILADGNLIILTLLTAKKHVMTIDTKIILDLFNNQALTPIECSQKIEEIYQAPPKSLVNDIIPFIKELYQAGVLQLAVRESQTKTKEISG